VRNTAWSAPGVNKLPVRDDVGIEKEIHRSISRGLSLRGALRPESRKEDSAKNSAKFPGPRVFRSHSSAETTTTAVRPFLVMICGHSPEPCRQAR
jgi:hypothetical protein